MLGLLLGSLLLAGCAATSAIPEDHFYRLATLDPLRQYSEPVLKGQLVIGRIKTYGIYHERAILYSPAGQPDTLKYHYYHHWIDKPPSLIRAQMIQYLRKTGLFEAVIAGTGRQVESVHLNPELKQFERQLGERGEVDVCITLGLRVGDGLNGATLLEKDYLARYRAKDGSMPASIHAFNAGMAEVYQRIMEDLIEFSSKQRVKDS